MLFVCPMALAVVVSWREAKVAVASAFADAANEEEAPSLPHVTLKGRLSARIGKVTSSGLKWGPLNGARFFEGEVAGVQLAV